MIKKLVIMATLAASSFPTSADNERARYFEFGTVILFYEESSVDEYSASPIALRFLFGTDINKNFAIEVLGAIGLSESTVILNGTYDSGLKYKTDSIFGFYLTPKLPLNEKAELFGRVGFASVSHTASNPDTGYSISQTEDGASYGLGIRIAQSNDLVFSIDYMSYLRGTSAEGGKVTLNGLTIGFASRF